MIGNEADKGLHIDMALPSSIRRASHPWALLFIRGKSIVANQAAISILPANALQIAVDLPHEGWDIREALLVTQPVEHLDPDRLAV